MSLYKYLKKGGPALPTPRTCGDSCLSRKDIEQANKEVKRTLGDLNQSGKKAVTPRGKYNSYTPEERAKIGKYAAENGSTRAARYFSELLEIVQRMVPFRLKNSARAADIFQGTWPTTALLRITATA